MDVTKDLRKRMSCAAVTSFSSTFYVAGTGIREHCERLRMEVYLA